MQLNAKNCDGWNLKFFWPFKIPALLELYATALADMLFRDLSRDIAFLHNHGIYRD